MDRDSLHAHIRRLLGDASAARYGDELLDDALRDALTTLSLEVPLILEATVNVLDSGTECDLDGLTRITQVLSVCYPWDGMQSVTPSLRSWVFYWKSGVPALRLFRGSFTAGESIRLSYCALHRLEGLDGAAETTVPDTLQALLGLGAAARAASMRAAALLEAHGSPASDHNQLFALGQNWWQSFTLQLMAMRPMGGSPQPALPGFGWGLEPR
ncbi:MAG: hypothetical protein HPY85_17070 [Anaerolineae bacterium]|nr:hypothetical protein [Anaerolineae bacterium]